MKSRTHNLFGFAVALRLSVSALGLGILYAVALSLYLSLSTNWAIDFLVGHRGGRRTPYTHSILGASLVSALSALLVPALGRVLRFTITFWFFAHLIMIAVAVGLSHLLLDAFTADGVYPLWPLKRSRASILNARYDDPVLNLVAIAISIALILSVVLDKVAEAGIPIPVAALGR